MRLLRHIMVIYLLAWPTLAGVTLVRDPIMRSVEPHWTDLGSAAYPFKTIYCDLLVAGGTNSIGGGGATNGVTFTNTVTLSPGSSAFCVNFGGMAGVFQLGIPAGTAGANGSPGPAGTMPTNAVLRSSQVVMYQTNLMVYAQSNFLARVNNLTSWNLGGQIYTNVPAPGSGFGMVGSYSGTGSWFQLFPGFVTTNAISVAVTNNMQGIISGLGSVTR